VNAIAEWTRLEGLGIAALCRTIDTESAYG
jgi:hypothetical protein